jgi:DmsE family decaheme c-type cytochrome
LCYLRINFLHPATDPKRNLLPESMRERPGEKYLNFLSLISVLIFLWSVLPPPEAAGTEGIVGVEMCKACHEDRYNSYRKSIHGNKHIPGSPATREDCESCHGPGEAHVEKSGEGGVGIFIFSKRLADAKAKSAKCLACHGEEKELSFWDLGRHKIEGISCDNCHTIHSGTPKSLKAPQPDLCNFCHKRVRAQQKRTSHHPIREGKIKCTDCHEQHGGFGPTQLKGDSVNELCYQCHAEKRGPFMWPHPPVDENCLNCHVPHGSNHNKLLNSRIPQLCQNCHNDRFHPSAPYTSFETFQGATPSNKMFARACLNCHGDIHGSNGPSTRGKVFVR